VSDVTDIQAKERNSILQLGFRSKTLEFVQHYIIEPFPIRPGVLHNLRLGVEVLDANVSNPRLTHQFRH
jgi:hypothetical protein